MVDMAFDNNEYDDAKREELQKHKEQRLLDAQPQIDELNAKIDELKKEVFAFKGKNRLKVNAMVDDEFAKRLDETQETGINLGRLTSEEMRKMRNRLQIIFQDPYSSLNPRMSVGQIISEAVHEHGMYKRNTPTYDEDFFKDKVLLVYTKNIRGYYNTLITGFKINSVIRQDQTLIIDETGYGSSKYFYESSPLFNTMYTRTLIIELNKGDVEGITNVETRGYCIINC